MIEKAKPYLLPQPKDIIVHADTFEVAADTLILIPAPAGDDAFFAARQLQAEVSQAVGPDLNIMKCFRPYRADNVILFLCGKEQAEAFGVEPPQTAAPEAVADQAYTLTITPQAITLYGDSRAGLFYAVQTLRQLVRLYHAHLLALTIHDWPTLAYRGLMLDVSRGKVPTLETLKELVEILSLHFAP